MKTEALLDELRKLAKRNRMAETIPPLYFEPGMMEFLDQSYVEYDPAQLEITFRFEARGTRYEGRPEFIESCTVGDCVLAVREPQNIHNTNNFFIESRDRHNLGNVPAELCNALAPLYDEGLITITKSSISYIEPLSKRSRNAQMPILFVEMKLIADSSLHNELAVLSDDPDVFLRLSEIEAECYTLINQMSVDSKGVKADKLVAASTHTKKEVSAALHDLNDKNCVCIPRKGFVELTDRRVAMPEVKIVSQTTAIPVECAKAESNEGMLPEETPFSLPKPLDYDGQLPYAFVSYAHNDSEVVYPILDFMNQNGFRVWYDRNLEPGKKWQKELAFHIDKCSIIISMLSKDYQESDICCNEISLAREKGKTIIFIQIDAVEMSDHLKVEFGNVQRMKMSDEAFFPGLLKSDILKTIR